MTSCSKSPFTNPWAFAPSASNKVWRPTSTQINKLKDVDPIETLQIPSEDDCISLGDLFDIALNNSPNTKHSWEEARESAANYSSEMSSYLPSLSFQGTYSAIRNGTVYDDTYFTQTIQEYGPEVNLKYLVWDSGKRRHKVEQAFQLLQQSNWMHNEEIQSVMLNVASAYYEFLYSKSLLEAYESNLQDAQQTFNAAQEKNLSGIFDETDMLQAKTHFLKKKVAVTTQNATVKNAFIDLLSVLGIPDNTSFHLGSFPDKEPFDPYSATEDQLIEIARSIRPDLLAAKAEILAAEASVKKQKAELYPTINFTGQGGEQWYSNGSNDGGNYTFTIDLTFPIFTGFYYLNQIKQAESDLEKLVATYRQTELQVVKMVKQSNNNFTMAKEEINDTLAYLKAAETEYAAMFDRYKLGIVDILDLLSSEAFLSDARAQYVNSQKTYYMAIIDIAFATGMLTNSCPWHMEDIE